MKHLLTGKEPSALEIAAILDCAASLKKNPAEYQTALAGKSLAMIFEKPSFRTRLSFALAMQTLGGIAIESVSTTRKSEEPRDLMRVLNGYCDCVMVRTHEDSILDEMANFAEIPVINGLTALYHPCQILADLLTLQEQFGSLEGLCLAYVGDGNNILHSLLLMAPQLGMTIHYCCPVNNQPNPAILGESRWQFPEQIRGFATPLAAVHNAHAVYTDVWTSMGFEQDSESQFDGFQVNEALMLHAHSNAVFMHCMPMERGKEVSETLPDSTSSVIFLQSENRLHVQKALLMTLLA